MTVHDLRFSQYSPWRHCSVERDNHVVQRTAALPSQNFSPFSLAFYFIFSFSSTEFLCLFSCSLRLTYCNFFLFNRLVPEFGARCSLQNSGIDVACSFLFVLLPSDYSGHSAFSLLHCTASVDVPQHQKVKECQFVMFLGLIRDTVCSLFTCMCSVIHCSIIIILVGSVYSEVDLFLSSTHTHIYTINLGPNVHFCPANRLSCVLPEICLLCDCSLKGIIFVKYRMRSFS